MKQYTQINNNGTYHIADRQMLHGTTFTHIICGLNRGTGKFTKTRPDETLICKRCLKAERFYTPFKKEPK